MRRAASTGRCSTSTRCATSPGTRCCARWNKGSGQVIGPLKSRHARRDLPIPLELADKLRAAVAGRLEDGLVFVSPETGRPYDPHHLHLRVLRPACAEAGIEWAGFHTF